MAQRKRPKKTASLSDVSPTPAEAAAAAKLYGRRVKLVRVNEGEGNAIEEEELLKRVGHEGVASSPFTETRPSRSVSVLFADGHHFRCFPDELEVCSDQRSAQVRSPVRATGPVRNVQSCIAHVGFPKTLAELDRALQVEGGYTDMELLLWPPADHAGGWTAPRWLSEGDVLFFYHTKRARQHIERLLAAAEDPSDEECLEDQLSLADRYAGNLFACAPVTGAPAFSRSEDPSLDENRHWRSNIYAAIGDVHVFQHPLPATDFRAHVTIRPGGALTPLHGEAFLGLKNLLAAHNELPEFLLNAMPGGVSFRDVTKDNWIEIACSPDARFIDESQLRAYMLDYLLEQLKDPRTTVHQECRCEHGHRCKGIADYFVSVGGIWLPVEAKLNVRAERDLPGQVADYIEVQEFVPTRGGSAGKTVKSKPARVCLVADSMGIYLVSGKGYVGCSAEKPLWRRTELSSKVIEAVREHLRQVVRQSERSAYEWAARQR